MKARFNDGWSFTEQPLSTNFSIADMARQTLTPVQVPHDWLIDRVDDLYRDSEGWYQKTFPLTSDQLATTLFLRFDGIYMDSTIYLNGQQIGEWKYGCTPVTVSLNAAARVGENILTVRARYQAPNARWYTGAGIYRDVWFYSLPQTYMPIDGNNWHASPVDAIDGPWHLYVDTPLAGQTLSGKATVQYILTAPNGEQMQQSVALTTGQVLARGELAIAVPHLWAPDTPNLYQLATTLEVDGVTQVVTQVIGLRQFEMTGQGARLNGQPIKLHGVCEHEDYGVLGGAIHAAAVKRRLLQLKQMGANAIRGAHNPHSEIFLQLADEMGFLVMSEFTDVWRHGKNQYDYARFFDEWWQRDLTAWIRRDRQHPSVVLWSIGNEIYDTHGSADGLQTAIMLQQAVQAEDPYHHAIITLCSNYMLWEPTQKVADVLKVIGYNYGENLYAKQHAEHPDWAIFGSETASLAASRGIYHFPLKQNILADDDFQCSALGNSATSWGARSLEECLINDLKTTYTAGQFLWTAHDYIGEPTPYHTKSAYLGQIDTAGLPKDGYYVCQAAWLPQTTTVLHIFPYWDFNPGQLIDVRIATNAASVELRLNGESLGRQERKDALILDWQVAYVPGTLTAIAFDAQGREIKRTTVQSFADASNLEVALATQTTAAGRELIFVTVTATDANGVLVANATNRVTLKVTGAGQLLGMDNGDSTDPDEYVTNSRRLFSGACVGVIAAKAVGVITITAQSPALQTKTVTCDVTHELPAGGAALPLAPTWSRVPTEIPIRKLALFPVNGQATLHFDADAAPATVCVQRYPQHADAHELIWRLTDEKGIDSTIARFTVHDDQVTLTPVANGTAYLRAETKNGRSLVTYYAEIPLTITGHKIAYLDPYAGVSGGRYTHSNVALTAGNERGVATLRGERSEVTFADVDFGDEGSDAITLSLFPLDQGPIRIEIWRGVPGAANSQCIDQVSYTRGSVWNTYKDQSFTLPRRFRGLETLTLVFEQKVHIKQFVFDKQQRAFADLSILDADSRYGDSFTVMPTQITHVGNNVTFTFDEMAFGAEGANHITITGACARANSIELKVTGDTALQTMLEFAPSATTITREFSLPKIVGTVKVEFIFLPGADFDFARLQFSSTEVKP